MELNPAISSCQLVGRSAGYISHEYCNGARICGRVTMTETGNKTGQRKWSSDNEDAVRTMRTELGEQDGNRAIDGRESQAANKRTRSAAIRNKASAVGTTVWKRGLNGAERGLNVDWNVDGNVVLREI